MIFAALGDETRLALVGRMSDGASLSITTLAEGASVTRQAITKHLRVLENVGMVRSTRAGRETLFTLSPEPLQDIQAYLATVSGQWSDALARLKHFAER